MSSELALPVLLLWSPATGLMPQTCPETELSVAAGKTVWREQTQIEAQLCDL